MKLRNVFFTAIACSVLVIAAGTNQNNGMSDTANGGSNGQMKDTMSVTGTIQQFDSTDSMIVIRSDTAADTLYITAMSQVPPMNQLQQGKMVTAMYKMEANRKVVISIKSEEPTASTINDTTNGVRMVSGTIEEVNKTDSSFVLKTEKGTETFYFDKKTKMSKSDLDVGKNVTVHYKEMNGKKMVTQLKAGSNGSAKNQKSSKY
jgi:hypothetical protein